MDYPEKLLRGISKEDEKDAQGRFTLASLQFQPNPKRENTTYLELSINWYDSEASLEEIRSREKEDGSLQFKGGVAQLDRKKIDFVANTANAFRDLLYERKSEDLNPFHGNILLNNSLDKVTKTAIRGFIAFDKFIE